MRGAIERVRIGWRGLLAFLKPRRLIQGILLLFLLLLAFLVLWAFLDWQLAPANSAERREIFWLIAQVLGGGILLGGVYVAWQNLRVSQEGQITDRFTRAIEHLGNDRLQIRLGGIYALERIARDSERDHWPIMEVLTTFVRENAPWKEGQPPLAQVGNEEAPRPATDIQTILTVIGRRTRWYRNGEDQRLDLRGVDLRGAYLGAAHLEGALLYQAHLEGAILWEAHLKGANLMEAHLEGANLWDAHLEEAYLEAARLEGAYLGRAHLERATLLAARLEGAYLLAAHMERAYLHQAHLEGANLRAAHMEGASLLQAHLEGANLEDATGLTRGQIGPAFTDEKTQLPDYLKAPAQGEQEAASENKESL